MGVENATSNASTSIRPQMADATNNQRCRGAVFCLFWHKMHLLRLYCPTSLKTPVLLIHFEMNSIWDGNLLSLGYWYWILLVVAIPAVLCFQRVHLKLIVRVFCCVLAFATIVFVNSVFLCNCRACIWYLCVFVFATILFEISAFLCICNNCIWNLCVSLYLQQLYLVMTRVLCRLWPLIVALPPVQLMARSRKR